jgi:hypothetical protein
MQEWSDEKRDVLSPGKAQAAGQGPGVRKCGDVHNVESGSILAGILPH